MREEEKGQAATATPTVSDAAWAHALARQWPGTRAQYAVWRRAKDAADAEYAAAAARGDA